MFMSVALAVLLGVALPSSAADAPAASPDPRNPRVRPNDQRSASVLLEGLERSATVRQIVDRLEADDVIVYVEMQPGMRRELAGRMVWLASTRISRYVRISLNPELSSEILISVLGHELRHALEVAVSPSIVDEASLEAYYKKNGFSMGSHGNGWDTQAARDTGELVRRELNDSPARVALRLSQLAHPSVWPAAYQRTRDRVSAR
jgi:hypothetical protein